MRAEDRQGWWRGWPGAAWLSWSLGKKLGQEKGRKGEEIGEEEKNGSHTSAAVLSFTESGLYVCLMKMLHDMSDPIMYC
jgi:hypothetical protein